MSYKYTYIDPTERTRIEGIIQSSLRDRNMELAFVRQQQIQKTIDKQTGKTIIFTLTINQANTLIDYLKDDTVTIYHSKLLEKDKRDSRNNLRY